MCPFRVAVTVKKVRKLVYFNQMKSKQIKNSAPTYVKYSSYVHIHYPFNITSSRCLITGVLISP
jgi:hypothetical protein